MALRRQKLSEGRTAEVFTWDDGRVLELFRPGWSEAVARWEFRLTRLANDAGAPPARQWEGDRGRSTARPDDG